MKVLIWGAHSQARVLAAMMLEERKCVQFTVFGQPIDRSFFPKETEFLSEVNALYMRLTSFDGYVVAVGAHHGYIRSYVASKLATMGLSPLHVMHRTAFVDSSTSVALGSQIMSMAVVSQFCEIGSQVIINTNASIDHECIIGDGVHVMGSAVVSGRVRVGDFVTIGSNATILPDLVIGEGSFIGAGAVVTRDVPPRSVWVGNPARYLRDVNLVDEEVNMVKLYDLFQKGA